ncbi:hypothetical protein HPP92_002056, partial [Vanilla planifolia]
IVSNGMYKSVVHRATLSREHTRISVVALTSPPLEAIVAPLLQLVDEVHRPIAFRATLFKEFITLRNNHSLEKT